MKLHEIKDIKQKVENGPIIVKESSTPIHLLMLLKEIVHAGKATNAVHYNVLLQVLEMFKYGVSHNPKYLYEFPSSKEQLDKLKELKAEQQVSLASWSLEQLVNEEYIETSTKFNNPAMELSNWITYVNKAQK
jgi:hypothetical protein